jgi:uncharacterized protein involved in outer membrane biogenesis
LRGTPDAGPERLRCSSDNRLRDPASHVIKMQTAFEKPMKKIIIGVLIALVALVVVVVVAVSFFLDSAIKKGVETYGPQFTKVDVKLDGVSLSLLSGAGSIKGLVVGNPEGYKSPHAISVGLASLSLSPGSLFSDKIVIKSVRVEAPDIAFELGSGGNNLKKILANVEAATGGGGESTTTKAPAESAKPGKKLEVDDFVISGAKVRVGATVLGGTAPIPLPDIHLTNLGTGPDGITPGELTKRILTAIEEGAVKAAAGAVTGLGKDAESAAKSAGKTATEAVGGVTKGVTDLFKKKQ